MKSLFAAVRRFIQLLIGTRFLTPYLAGAVVEGVAVDGASLPVLDLYKAGAFGRAAILQRLNGRGSALCRRLERAEQTDRQTFTHESLLHAIVLYLAKRF